MSPYKLGWIGIRSSRTGRSVGFLKRDGWIKQYPAFVNNRNAWNWVKPCVRFDQFLSKDWSSFANAGLDGIAVWFTDAQWGTCAGITDKQWQCRAIIEASFNSAYPTGRR